MPFDFSWKITVRGYDFRKAIEEYDKTPKAAVRILDELRNMLDIHRTKNYQIEEFLLLLDGEDEAFFTGLEEGKESYQTYNMESLDDWIENRLFEFWTMCDYERIFVGFESDAMLDRRAKEVSTYHQQQQMQELKHKMAAVNDAGTLFD